MVDQIAELDQVFHALSSEPRREILRRSAHRPCSVSELAGHFEMSLAAVSKHIHVLEAANLISQTREGRIRWCRLNPKALEPARTSIDSLRTFWDNRLDALEKILEVRPTESRNGKKA